MRWLLRGVWYAARAQSWWSRGLDWALTQASRTTEASMASGQRTRPCMCVLVCRVSCVFCVCCVCARVCECERGYDIMSMCVDVCVYICTLSIALTDSSAIIHTGLCGRSQWRCTGDVARESPHSAQTGSTVCRPGTLRCTPYITLSGLSLSLTH